MSRAGTSVPWWRSLMGTNLWFHSFQKIFMTIYISRASAQHWIQSVYYEFTANNVIYISWKKDKDGASVLKHVRNVNKWLRNQLRINDRSDKPYHFKKILWTIIKWSTMRSGIITHSLIWFLICIRVFESFVN